MRNCLCIVIALISSVSRGQDVAPGRPASEYLAEADRLAGLRAWTRAERFFVHAERAFEEAGDSRNALYAKLGRIRGELPRRSVADVSQQLAEILELPLAMTDDRIRLRCLIIKGEVDMDYDADLAEQDWREALTIAKRLNDPLWVNRANAELGITVALQGRTSDGLFMIASALKNAEATKDLSSVVRWSSVIGKGLFQFGRPEEALKLFDRAIAAGSSVDELRFSLMAYLGKITALTKLKRFEEARELLATTLAVARERESFGYQAELLLTGRVAYGSRRNSGGCRTAVARSCGFCPASWSQSRARGNIFGTRPTSTCPWPEKGCRWNIPCRYPVNQGHA